MDKTLYFENYYDTQIKPNTILFDSFWGRKIACNPYAIFKEMYTRHEFSSFMFTWVKNDDVKPPSWMEEKENINYVTYRSIEYAEMLLSAEYVVANTNFPGYFIRKPYQKYINLWHGVPLKHMGRDMTQPSKNSFNTQRNFTQSTHIFLSSDYAVDKTVRAFGNVFATQRTHIVGSPRVDLTLNANSNKIRNRLGIIGDKKIILYAPTWRGSIGKPSSNMGKQLTTIKRLSNLFGEEYEVLLSIHNYTKHNFESEHDSCHIVPDYIPINEVLAATDVLISDYSSIIFDFLPLDRPIILYTYDLGEYKSIRGLYLDINDLPVNIAQTSEQLMKALTNPKRPSESEHYKNTIHKLLPMEDGKASKRAVDLLVDNTPRKACKDSNKTTILFHAGTFQNNGITHSFLNLVNSIDYKKYDVSIIIDCTAIDKSENAEYLFGLVPSHCRVILRSQATFIHDADRLEYKEVLAGTTQKQPSENLKKSFELEARRIFSDTKYDIAINFAGYSAWWAIIISMVTADKHICYQHSDLLKEATNTLRDNKKLFQVFNSYKNYDVIASVSPNLKEINDKNLSSYYKNSKSSVFARNIVIPQEIKAIARQAHHFRSIFTQKIRPTTHDQPG